MSEVATTSGLSCSLKRKRSSSSDENESQCLSIKPRYYYVLAPETPDERGSDTSESVYSIQEHSTDFAKDTSDTVSTVTFDEGPVVVEFEPPSSDEPCYPFAMDGSSSSPMEEPNFQPYPTTVPSDFVSVSGKESSSATPKNAKRSGRRRPFKFTKCVRCNDVNTRPTLRYCFRCYMVRKDFFPPRPKWRISRSSFEAQRKSRGRKGVFKKDSGVDVEGSPSTSKEVCVEKPSSEAKNESDNDSSQTNESEKCGTCMVQPKNGGYVHKRIVHVFSCYQCSNKTLKKYGRCPICNLKVNRVCKVITV